MGRREGKRAKFTQGELPQWQARVITGPLKSWKPLSLLVHHSVHPSTSSLENLLEEVTVTPGTSKALGAPAVVPRAGEHAQWRRREGQMRGAGESESLDFLY